MGVPPKETGLIERENSRPAPQRKKRVDGGRNDLLDSLGS